MINYIVSSKEHMVLLMESRLEMLKTVNNLPSDYVFDKDLILYSKRFFESANQTTILAVDHKAIGCATLCYIEMMPTFSHPTGKRAHLLNVYTNSEYRRQGIAYKMIIMLIQEAKKKGVTEISLDATEMGRPLYEKLGFTQSNECMVKII